MNGWLWSLLAYAGLWIALNALVWLLNWRRVEIVDGPGVRELCHQPSELFLAMSDEVLLLDCADDRTPSCVLRDVAGMDFDPGEARHSLN